jgi:hypothetical protein
MKRGDNNKHKETQGIIRDYFENLYSNKLENLAEMNTFLDTYCHAKLDKEDLNNLNRSITCNKIEAAMKNFPKKKSPRPHGFTTEFYQTIKELIPHSLNFSTI